MDAGEARQKRQIRLDNERIYGQPLPQSVSGNWLLDALVYWIPFWSSSSGTGDLVVGVLDEPSRSVWVIDQEQQMTLWRKGFFGKGSLSRSEPSWLKREINRLQAEKMGKRGTAERQPSIKLTLSLDWTAEEMTAKRRMIRKQFKQQRAEAIAAAEAEAEISFASNPNASPVINTLIPSTQTASLNKRLQAVMSKGDDEPLPRLTPEETPDNMEHLQMSLPEAFFLAWTTACLVIREAESGELISLQEFWMKCQTLWSPLHSRRTDNPFLVHYVAYHHFRALGWVVKSGIKFCADYLLYKKGPTFHHAEFAVVVVPSYVDGEDQETCPYNFSCAEPMSWQWFSTLNRVNTQVMKVRSQ